MGELDDGSIVTCLTEPYVLDLTIIPLLTYQFSTLIGNSFYLFMYLYMLKNASFY